MKPKSFIQTLKILLLLILGYVITGLIGGLAHIYINFDVGDTPLETGLWFGFAGVAGGIVTLVVIFRYRK